jgi:methionine synthase I (cobalamin-dependent)
MTTEADGNSLDGTPPEAFAPALERAGADVIGVNCSVGPAAMLETIEAIARITSARLVAQPNAGRPRDVEGRNLYLSSPDYMASYALATVGGVAQHRAAEALGGVERLRRARSTAVVDDHHPGRRSGTEQFGGDLGKVGARSEDR